jgi:nucleoside-diphosphate-sugar epimerase
VEAAERAVLSPEALVRNLLTGTADIIAVTGATGWFGRTTLELLFGALGDAAAARVLAYASRPTSVELTTGHTVAVRPLHELPTARPSPTIVLHFACLTRDRERELGTAAYLQANLDITTTVLRALEAHTPRVLVATSSGAAAQYGGASGLDLEHNAYGTLKRLDELAFAHLADQLGSGYALPRVYSVAGPWMTKPLKYALGSMVATALAGGPITINAERPVWRSYCGVAEVVALSLWMAAEGANTVFDTGGHLVEMADLAGAVARTVGGGCGISRPAFDPDAAADRYVGDPAVFDRAAHETGLRAASLDDLVTATEAGFGIIG